MDPSSPVAAPTFSSDRLLPSFDTPQPADCATHTLSRNPRSRRRIRCRPFLCWPCFRRRGTSSDLLAHPAYARVLDTVATVADARRFIDSVYALASPLLANRAHINLVIVALRKAYLAPDVAAIGFLTSAIQSALDEALELMQTHGSVALLPNPSLPTLEADLLRLGRIMHRRDVYLALVPARNRRILLKLFTFRLLLGDQIDEIEWLPLPSPHVSPPMSQPRRRSVAQFFAALSPRLAISPRRDTVSEVESSLTDFSGDGRSSTDAGLPSDILASSVAGSVRSLQEPRASFIAIPPIDEYGPAGDEGSNEQSGLLDSGSGCTSSSSGGRMLDSARAQSPHTGGPSP
jgi:hypothetical protein